MWIWWSFENIKNNKLYQTIFFIEMGGWEDHLYSVLCSRPPGSLRSVLGRPRWEASLAFPFHHQHHHHQCRHQSVFGRPTIQPACTYCHSFHQFSVFQPTHSLPFQPVLHFFLLQTFSSKSGLYFWISMLLIRYYDLTCGKVYNWQRSYNLELCHLQMWTKLSTSFGNSVFPTLIFPSVCLSNPSGARRSARQDKGAPQETRR